MFDSDAMTDAARALVIEAAAVRGWTRQVAAARGVDDDGSRLELISALEELKCAAEGLQADLAVDVDASMRQRAAERSAPMARQGQGVAAEVALARRVSLHRGQQALGLAKGAVCRDALHATGAPIRSDQRVAGDDPSPRDRLSLAR